MLLRVFSGMTKKPIFCLELFESNSLLEVSVEYAIKEIKNKENKKPLMVVLGPGADPNRTLGRLPKDFSSTVGWFEVGLWSTLARCLANV